MQWLLIIAIGFIAVMYPIVMFLYTFTLAADIPLIILAMLAWLAAVGFLAFVSADKKVKDSRRTTAFVVIAVAAVIYGLVLGGAYGGSYYADGGGDILFMALAPAVSSPQFSYIAMRIGGSISKQRRESELSSIAAEEEALIAEIHRLNGELEDKKSMIELVLLLESCGAEATGMKACFGLSQGMLLADEIRRKSSELESLKKQKAQLEES